MNVGSLFSGIGGFDLGLERAGMRVVWQCESDPYRRRVLRRHWPGVSCFEDVREVAAGGRERPLAGDMGRVRHGSDAGRCGSWAEDGDTRVDLICGGFPCQDLSVAGRRAGLAGERSGLFYEFMRVADAVLPDGGFVLIENVPGLLSSNGGRDFAIVLASLAELGFHDLAYRVLDSRYFGVPQRRRRVYVLARRAGGRVCSEVLLEPESGGGDFTKGRETRKGVAGSVADGAKTARSLTASERWDGETEEFVAGTLGGRSDRAGGQRLDLDGHGAYVPVEAKTLQVDGGGIKEPDHADYIVAHTLRSEGFDASEDGTGRGTPLVCNPADSEGLGGRSGAGSPGAEPERRGTASRSDGGRDGPSPDPDGVRAAPGLPRRVDDPKPDGPRYAACGDAVTVNVSYWIGRRLLAHDGALPV